MNDDGVRQRGLEYAKYLAGIPSEVRARINERNRKQGDEEHKTFREKFQAGRCSVCGDALTTFDRAKPCPHWLLKPPGFGKEHFDLLTEKYSFIQLEHYLRWVANEGAFAKTSMTSLMKAVASLLNSRSNSRTCDGHSRAAQAISAGTKVAASSRNGPIGIFKCTSMKCRSFDTTILMRRFRSGTLAYLNTHAITPER